MSRLTFKVNGPLLWVVGNPYKPVDLVRTKKRGLPKLFWSENAARAYCFAKRVDKLWGPIQVQFSYAPPNP